jgi:Holliday junction DNA helicase RuvA
MITQITGILIENQVPAIVIDVHGIGYEVFVPTNIFEKLPALGEKIKLYTYFLVREDQQRLFGFIEKNDRALFCELLKASGVGPKMALTIISGYSYDILSDIIHNQDSGRLTKLPGVGRKTAERLVIELKDKIKKVSRDNPKNISSVHIDAVYALEALGYNFTAAQGAVNKITKDNLSCEQLIKEALQYLA